MSSLPLVWPNKPDGANRRQPLGCRERVGESSVRGLTAAVAHPGRSAASGDAGQERGGGGTQGICACRFRGRFYSCPSVASVFSLDAQSPRRPRLRVGRVLSDESWIFEQVGG